MKLKITFYSLLATIVMCLIGTLAYAQPNFTNKIEAPPLIDANDGLIDLHIQQVNHRFNPSDLTDTLYNGNANQPDGIGTWAYNIPGETNMTFLGPTLKWTTRNMVSIRVTNMLPASSTLTEVTTTTTHWHGAEVPAYLDGGPHQPIMPDGGEWPVDFVNLDSASTMWYHPHLHNQTFPHVQLGLSGIVISEQSSDLIGPTLPRTYGIDDIPIIIGDQSFVYDAGEDKMKVFTLKGKRPTNIVNGYTNPYLEVPAHFVRLRVLNGSTRKGIQFGLSPSRTDTNLANFDKFTLVATDGGYTLKPDSMTTHLTGPGERTEIILDLREYNPGDTLYLRNLKELMPGSIVGSPNPSEGPGGGRDSTMGNAFLQLRVIADPPMYTPVDVFTPFLTDWDPTLQDTTDFTNRRTKELVFIEQMIVDGDTLRGFMIDSMTYDIGIINDTICEGAKEIWTIDNKSDIAHPFHIHKIFFRIIGIDSTGADGTVHQLDLEERGFNGPKDDVLVLPGWRLRFMGKFDDYASAIDPTETYMYHCHILTHEDQEGGGMMHQFVVTDDPACMAVDVEEPPESSMALRVYPVPSSGWLNLQANADRESTLRIIDLQGRVVKEQQLPPFNESIRVNTDNIPKGMYILNWHTYDGQITSRKVIIQ